MLPDDGDWLKMSRWASSKYTTMQFASSICSLYASNLNCGFWVIFSCFLMTTIQSEFSRPLLVSTKSLLDALDHKTSSLFSTTSLYFLISFSPFTNFFFAFLYFLILTFLKYMGTKRMSTIMDFRNYPFFRFKS